MARIIAGTAGGVRLAVPRGTTTRPTTDRVREALFASLAVWAGGAAEGAGQQLAGLAFLDLFAGSGALGLEAASRGARRVVWVEKDRGAAGVIAKNLTVARLTGRVVTESVATFLARPASELFDVALLDPPYGLANDEITALLAAAVGNGHMAPDGLVVVERDARTPAPRWPPGLSLGWSRRYGESYLYFCPRGAESESEHDA